MDQFNQKANRATHGALSFPALKDGASCAILDDAEGKIIDLKGQIG